ncbi:hypothetical protein [Sphingomonas crocodyli]|uniref:hypothetical protein n=1 Tax=Sphingomonas crocodyli TaxID=1979270 RepID=UPI0013E3B387|nr:hypothetical protein [Sphingomonas crocodyli]
MQPLDRDYLETRRTESLRMAAESGDPCAAVHRELAALYGQRLLETDESRPKLNRG